MVTTRAQAHLEDDVLIEIQFRLLGSPLAMKARVVEMVSGSCIRLEFIQPNAQLSEILRLLEEAPI